jgi:hypothetical protein
MRSSSSPEASIHSRVRLKNWLREVTGVADGIPGTVTFLQHFGSSLNLHVHFHLLALDGVLEPSSSDDGPLTFVRAPVPTVAELDVLVQQLAVRSRRLVESAGPAPEPPEVQAPMLKLIGAEPHEPASPALVASFDGFNLHAGTSFEAHERVAVERYCRYALRTPLAQGRLTETASGSLLYRLKAPKPDGTSHIAFSPAVLLQRIRWLIPLPRIHLTRYHGILAPAHPLRSRVVPSPPETEPPLTGTQKKSRWIDWADLLKRVFALDVLACVCGARRRVMAVIKDEQVARKLLDHLGLPSIVPELGRAPESPQGELWATGPPHDEFAQAPAPEDFDQRLATSDLSD